jgi:hypothetical protein
MTVATLGANKNADALFAWDEAVKLGLSRDNVSPLERSQFDSVKVQIEQLQATSAEYDDEQPLGDRRRGENNYAMSAR